MITPAQATDHMAEPLHSEKCRIQACPAQRIVDDIETLSIRETPDILLDCFSLEIDRYCTNAAQVIGLVGTIDGSDLSAFRNRNLHHHMPNPTSAAKNQHLLAGLDGNAIHEPFPGSDEDERYRCGFTHVQAFGLVRKQARIDARKLRERALHAADASGHAEDFISGLETVHAIADRLDDACKIDPQDGRQRVPGMGGRSRLDFRVERIKPTRAYSDKHLTLAGVGRAISLISKFPPACSSTAARIIAILLSPKLSMLEIWGIMLRPKTNESDLPLFRFERLIYVEWSDIRIFLAIARAGTLGAGARELGISQPTVGRRLRALEAALRQTLFQRTSDGLVLTDEGHLLLDHAERMEHEAEAISRKLDTNGEGLSGPLRLSSSDWFGIHILSPILGCFVKKHPNVVPELVTDSRLLSLSRREVDLAFRIRPFEEPDIVSRKLLTIRYGLFVASGSETPFVGDGGNVRKLIMNEQFTGMPDVAWFDTNYPKSETAFRSNSREAQARLCAQGVGMAVLPLPLAQATTGLMQIDVATPPPSRVTWLGYHRDLRHLPRLRALIDFLVREIAA